MAVLLLIIGWLVSIVAWVMAGIWTWEWIEPHSFGSGLLWLIVFSIVATLARGIVGIVFAALASVFD